MKTMTSDHDMKVQAPFSRRAMRIVLVAALLLLVPLVSMQLTKEVNWGLFDFVAAAALLVGTGLMYEIAASKLSSSRSRAIAGIVLAAALLLVWAELAVGIFH